ncbi:DHA2 family efflux MFS transporter permease subunit [Kitasatospora sp. NPDC092948]|uniref:DHA2 family efflux MFS transporter permease subunit n=1 Tax=Kitasatospora sp. NPDC092948 TaxID=3364088 RepID=UPI0037FE414E
MSQDRADRLEPALVRMIAVILLGGILGILNSTMASVATGTLAHEFGTSLNTISWTSTGFLLAVCAMIPFTSWAVDRFGSKRMWLIGLTLFLAASLLCAAAWDVGSLIVFRALQGVAAGILDPLVLVLLARAAGPARAGRVMGLMGVVLSLGPVLGPIAGGAVLQSLSWRWMFLLGLPIGLIALLLAVKVVPTDQPAGPEQPRVRLDVIGLALLGPGFAVLVLAMTQSAEQGAFAVWQVLLPLILGAVMLIGYAAHALRAGNKAPLIDLRLFKNTSFTASVTVMTLSGLATFASLFALPLYYQQAHGHGTLVAGLLVAPVGLGAALAMPMAGALSDRMGSRGLAQGGAVVAALGGFALTQVGADTFELWPSLAALVMGLGLGFVGAPTMGSLYRTLPMHLVPQGSSVLYMLNQLGAGIGIALVTVILKTVGGDDVMRGIHGVYWFAIATLAVLLVATLFLPGKVEAPPAPVEEVAPVEQGAPAAH